ncbi:ArnT family glycosyltransferase [Hydrogenovibrio kuenenii]|uniref:ArnT family glycosyltransferase n=1 Tax=Hydrogenovibrio kuenenii TaxID=63658 RepID=UPI00046732EE|nr:hypothetical protein [Hydrogenovibrio kuenenii]
MKGQSLFFGKRSFYEQGLLPFLLVLIHSLYLYIFLYFPISEDTGFYGFLAKSIANGAILHTDIPVATNGISIYLMAGLMKVFGPSLELVRLYYWAFYIGVTLLLYFIIKKESGYPFLAFILASVATLLLYSPQVTLDLGRTPIVVSLFLVLLFIHVWFSEIRYRTLYGGVLLGLAAINREPFIFILLAVFVYFLSQVYRNQIKWKELIGFSLAAALALSINAILLTAYGNWSTYFFDMLHSGAGFRYSGGLLSLERLEQNLHRLTSGYYAYPYNLFQYYPIVVLGLTSYFFKTESNLINFIKYIVLPAFVVVEIIINKTASYSIQPIIVCLTVLSSLSIVNIFKKFESYINNFAGARKNSLLFVDWLLLVGLLVFIFVLPSVAFMYKGYKLYYFPSVLLKTGAAMDATPKRLLAVTNRIHHRTVSTFSQYPFLFLSNTNYRPKMPYAEDLTMPYNMGRPELRTSQLNMLRKNPPDLYVDKSGGKDFLSKWTDLGGIVANEYILIAYFFRPKDVFEQYRERIFLSKKLFKKTFFKMSQSNGVANEMLVNHSNSSTIFKVTPVAGRKCLGGLSVVSGVNHVQYDYNYFKDSDDGVYIFVQPNAQFKIYNSQLGCNQFKVEGFQQK